MSDQALREGVLRVLREATVPLYAREIATELTAEGMSVDRTAINQLLYGELKTEVTKSADHRWRLADRVGSLTPAAPAGSDEAGAATDADAGATQGSSKARRPAKAPSVDPSVADPTCPDCGAPMVKRTARRGRDAGKQFWGCTAFPDCRGTLSIRSASEVTTGERPGAERAASPIAGTALSGADRRLPRPIAWYDATISRPGWICRHGVAGASLRSAPSSREAFRPLSVCWLARPDTGTSKPSEELKQFSGSINKILQRGICPPLDPYAERILLEEAGLKKEMREPLPGELGPRLKSPPAFERDGLRDLWAGMPPEIDPQLELDSDEEWLFLTEWAPEHLDAVTVRSIIPQAPLDSLALAAGIDRRGMRRVDFLVQPSDSDPFVVEIDGGQHADSQSVDTDRDEVLAQLGFDVIRITTDEMRALAGPALDAVKARAGKPRKGRAPGKRETLLTQAPALLHRTVLALVEARTAGLLDGDEWVVEIDEPLDIVPLLIQPYLDLMLASDILASSEVMPARIEIRGGGRTDTYVRDGARYVIGSSRDQETDPDVAIVLEPDASPLDELGAPGEIPVIVVRSAHIPVRIADPFLESSTRTVIEAAPDACSEALEVLLQGVFAKEHFRDGQLEALQRVIEGQSCAVLLPTGAGKSLIYQLAGLVLPGRTIIIDPIIALMEDQVRGLEANGIDRVVDISRASVSAAGPKALLETVASGDALFIFMAPERLQQGGFREALRTLAQRTTVNIAVVDEAHCVSEWGHDFRTAYLNLGRILKGHLSSGATDPGPPILALTGTASRAVLRDVLNELEIEAGDGDAIIQPNTFDRPELQYRIQAESPQNAVAALTGAVASLPSEFGLPPSTFFHPRGEETMSGLVFCPWVNGTYGVATVARELEQALQITVPFYSGGPPKGWPARDWDTVKRHNADAFKDNEAPLLVSTKAFGMGIDKPNVRYVVHLGIPGSIEAYYQEVGRAGRDRDRSECILITTEYDEARARRMLADDADLEQVREEHSALRRSGGDDVTRMLFFLLNTFIGEEAELATITGLLDAFGDGLGSAGTVFIPMEGADKEEERGLHRLVILGVLRDYLVDWGGKSYQAELATCTPRTVFEHLIAYVRRSQPGQADLIEAELARIETMPLHEAIHEAAQRLIQFVYDTVERSRRRSLREMWLAAREGREDPNGTFRRRILDYLTQGNVAPTLEALAEEDRVDLDRWTALLDEVWRDTMLGDAEAARELRGGTGRLLASYPDHPGLLLARGVSEALIPDGELEELQSNLASARASGSSRYGLSDDDFSRLGDWLLRRSREWQQPGVLTAVVLGMADDDGPPLNLVAPEDMAIEPGLAVLALTDELTKARDLVSEIVGALTD